MLTTWKNNSYGGSVDESIFCVERRYDCRFCGGSSRHLKHPIQTQAKILPHDREARRTGIQKPLCTRSRAEAESRLHQEITRQIRKTSLNPFDGTTEYRLFGETFTEILPGKMMVFRHSKRQS